MGILRKTVETVLLVNPFRPEEGVRGFVRITRPDNLGRLLRIQPKAQLMMPGTGSAAVDLGWREILVEKAENILRGQ